MRFPGLLLAALLAGPVAFAGFEEAAAVSRRQGGHLLLVWENGVERSALEKGWTVDVAQPVFSITKSLTALAWLHRFGPERKVDERLTAEHLLSQTSGLDPGYAALYRKNLSDVREAAIGLRRLTPPGREFVYGPAHFERLGAAFPSSEAASEFAWRQLGIVSAGWRRDKKGQPFCSTGACLSARELVVLGRVLLENGRRGWARVIPPDRMRRALRGSAANPAYGLGFWLNSNASRSDAREEDVERAISYEKIDWARFALSRTAPADLVAMVGSRGQRVYVVPSRRLVIVRLGNSRTFSDPAFLRAFFTPRVE